VRAGEIARRRTRRLWRRSDIGTIVIPEVICNFFLALDVTFPAAEAAGSVKLGAGDRVGDTHTVEQSRSVELGGAGAGASVDLGRAGRRASAHTRRSRVLAAPRPPAP
jgi:hypothetical protein